jgi:hypothetical protein
MSISKYLCFVIGENPDELRKLSKSTINRAKAFAIAIHLPVALWAASGFLIAYNLFKLPTILSALTSLGCSILVYLLERIVLAAPRSGGTKVARILIGLITAVLGTLMVDLVIFDREIAEQLGRAGEARIAQEYATRRTTATAVANTRDQEWLAAEQRAECEANGTCGSGVRSTGPVYMELKRHADVLHQEYVDATVQLESLAQEETKAIAHWRANGHPTESAGLLARSQALHQVLADNRAAQIWWLVMFLFVASLEMMVVIVKTAFKPTVDDERAERKEAFEIDRIKGILAVARSPDGEAQSMLWSLYGKADTRRMVEQLTKVPEPSSSGESRRRSAA